MAAMKPYMIVRLADLRKPNGPATVVRLVESHRDLTKFRAKAKMPDYLRIWWSQRDVAVGDQVFQNRDEKPATVAGARKRSASDILEELARLEDMEDRGSDVNFMHLPPHLAGLRGSGTSLWTALNLAHKHVYQEKAERELQDRVDAARFVKRKKRQAGATRLKTKK